MVAANRVKRRSPDEQLYAARRRTRHAATKYVSPRSGPPQPTTHAVRQRLAPHGADRSRLGARVQAFARALSLAP